MKLFGKWAGYLLVTALSVTAFLFLYFNLPGPRPREDVQFGITFSARYAESLGLNWKETYMALLDDMRVRKIRLPLYWDAIEKERGAYDFADADWQVEEARKRGAEMIVTVGQKVPRWPECFAPEWVNAENKKDALLAFEKKAVERYRDIPEVIMWQVENEPFLKFGDCPNFDLRLLDEEIALVKSLDATRPILTTDSGELSLWIPAASRGDVFGTTLYRDIWSKYLNRYVTYPIGPNFFLFKELMTRLFTDQTRFIVIELQAEPWAHRFIVDTPLEEQALTMNAERLVGNIEYAKQVGFSDIYLWGAEWWYWMKVAHHDASVWNAAKGYFR
jgi:hypothetical protein